MSCSNSKKIKREQDNKYLPNNNNYVEQFHNNSSDSRNNNYEQSNNSWGNTGPCWNTTGSCGDTKPTLTQCSNLDSKEYYYPSLADNGKFNGDYATLNNTWGNQKPYNA